jgi:exonuclease VII large subunit
MPIPVIVAVGHTSDVSLLDEVAKLPCKTPSDAAHEIVAMYHETQQNLLSIQTHTRELYYQHLGRLQQSVDRLKCATKQARHQRLLITQTKIKNIMADIVQVCPVFHYEQGYVSLHDAIKTKLDAIP